MAFTAKSVGVLVGGSDEYWIAFDWTDSVLPDSVAVMVYEPVVKLSPDQVLLLATKLWFV